MFVNNASLFLFWATYWLTFQFTFPGMTAALTNESATSKSVYFAHCTSEMIFITHLLAEEPEKLAGPLLADTYVTLLKGRNSWYGQMLAKGELSRDMGENISGKGMIQVSIAISAKHFYLSEGLFLTSAIIYPLGCLGSGSLLRTSESVKPECLTSWRKQAGCSCWALPHLEDSLQNTYNKVIPPNWNQKIWIPAFIYEVGRVRYAPKCVQVPCVPLTTSLNK